MTIQSNVKRWLNNNLASIESLSDQELKERYWAPESLIDQKLILEARRKTKKGLDELRKLEQKLKHAEWLAQCVWYEAGKTGPFDFDDLYEMVGPLDVVAFGPLQRYNLRSKLDALLSDTLTANELEDKLGSLIDLPATGVSVNRSSPAIKLVRAFCFSFPNTLFIGLPCQKRSIWALVIGIDNYQQAPLRCAVADAEAMSEFLKVRLSVPPDHITELLARSHDSPSSNYPTRQNILSKLWSLRRDERIKYGDTIIVFYSGHGAAYSSGGLLRSDIRVEESDRDWNSFYQRNRINFHELNDNPSGPFIDSIVPADRGELDSDPSYFGTRIPDICDRELNTIFTVTRQVKGPNILFIADCCFAASVARSGPDVTKWRDRSLPPLERDDMKEMLLRAQWNINRLAWEVCIFPVVYYG